MPLNRRCLALIERSIFAPTLTIRASATIRFLDPSNKDNGAQNTDDLHQTDDAEVEELVEELSILEERQQMGRRAMRGSTEQPFSLSVAPHSVEELSVLEERQQMG
ncbi:hypothetical protein V498_05720 [Pseudogymnoascus sp. VKM F-4517 (FW-2822)]|nr:hypothetical protein V498_05720 [Pseudogymnoascus sp. VKM F-4517 (FW-2822)]